MNPPDLPSWIDGETLQGMLAGDPEHPIEALTLAGRLLLATRVSPSLRKDSRRALAGLLHGVGLSAIEEHGETAAAWLDGCLADIAAQDDDPPARVSVIALMKARHDLEALRAVLSAAFWIDPPLTDEALVTVRWQFDDLTWRAEALDREVLSRLDGFRRIVARPPATDDEARMEPMLLDAISLGANPWWLDLLDPALRGVPRLAAPTATVGLAGSTLPGTTLAEWDFDGGYRMVCYRAKGDFIADLRRYPKGSEPRGLDLLWIEGEKTHRATFALSKLGDWKCHPPDTLLASEAVALRRGESFFVRRP